jgi:hypothetical protein
MRFARRGALIGAVVVASALAMPARASAPPTTFDGELVDTQQGGTEPAVRVDRAHGYEYVTAVGDGANGGNVVWTSRDSGAHWRKGADTGGGGGDSDIAFDADGTLFVLDLLKSGGGLTTTIPFAVSHDHGVTYDRAGELDPSSSTGIAWDRQWIAATGSATKGTVIATAHSAHGIFAWVSHNGGASWDGPHQVVPSAAEGGPIVFAPNGRAYLSYWDTNSNGDLVISIASSRDGVTWSTSTVATQTDSSGIGFKGIHWPVITPDRAGNVFVTWAAGQVLGVDNALSSTVYISEHPAATSASWSPPLQLSDPAHAAVFPWAVAGRPGKVDVAWYEATQAGGLPDPGPDLGGAQTTWNVVMAQSTNGMAAAPAYALSTAVKGFHTGSICTGGLEACPGPQQVGVGNAPTPFDRRVLDFFTIDLDTYGNAVIAYPKDRPRTTGAVGDVVFAWCDIFVARQLTGPTI